MANLNQRLTARQVFGILFALFVSAISPQCGKYVSREWQVRQFRQQMEQEDMFQTLETYAPDAYARIEADVVEAIRSDRSTQDAYNSVHTEFEALFQQKLPLSSDEVLQNYVLTLITMVKNTPEMCPVFLGQTQASNTLSKADQQELFAIMADVIRTASEDPKSTYNAPQAQASLSKIQTDLALTYGDDLEQLQNIKDPAIDSAQVCLILRDFYKRITQLPEQESVHVLRYIFSSQTN